jgi:hypothetical protein
MTDAERLAYAHAALDRIDRLVRALADSPNDDVDDQIRAAVYEAIASGSIGEPLRPVIGGVAELLPQADAEPASGVPQPAKRPLIAVVVEGGMVQTVAVDGEWPAIDLVFIDYDTKDGDDVCALAQGDGGVTRASITDAGYEAMSPAIAADLHHWLDHGRTKSDAAKAA